MSNYDFGSSVGEQESPLRKFDDDTLLDMFDHAHETSDEHCDAIAAELQWRGIAVQPCTQTRAR